MLYAWIKILHIISSAVLFGTGLGTAFYMFYVNQQKNITLIAKATSAVVVADWFFTATSGVIQALTGFMLIYLKGYSLGSLWIIGSVIGYGIAGVCWLPVVWLQMQCRDLAIAASLNNTPLALKYKIYFRIWWLLGIPAFIALVCVFYLMTNKPESFNFLGQLLVTQT